jgi:hypothetical protein
MKQPDNKLATTREKGGHTYVDITCDPSDAPWGACVIGIGTDKVAAWKAAHRRLTKLVNLAEKRLEALTCEK